MDAETVDILIAGGGPVGAALALALEGSGHSVVLTEARSADSGGARGVAAGDARAIALSHASRLILERLHAWSELPVTPIETIHISQQGGFGRTLIRAADCDVPALGYVAGYDELQQCLLAAPCSARRLFGAKLTGFDGSTAVVQTQQGERALRRASRCSPTARASRTAAPRRATTRTTGRPPWWPGSEPRKRIAAGRGSASRPKGRSRCCRMARAMRWYGLPRRIAARACARSTPPLSSPSCTRVSAAGWAHSLKRANAVHSPWRCATGARKHGRAASP